MRKIAIEIECEEKKCGKCKKQYGDDERPYFRFCILFQQYLGNNIFRDVRRLPECLNAEVKENPRLETVKKRAKELGVLGIEIDSATDTLECLERTLDIIEENKEILDRNTGEMD